MARYAKTHVPSYRLHKKSGQAVVTIGGKDTYLGSYSKDESAPSKEAYNKLIAQWYAAGRNAVALAQTQAATAAAVEVVNVEEVIATFWAHAQTYYRDKDGRPTSELKNFKDSLRTLRQLYGKSAAAAFDSECLELCQTQMIRDGLSRNTINRRIGRIRQVFKFAVRKKMVPAAVLAELQTVPGLKLGRTEAKETEPVKSVAEAHVHAVAAAASRTVGAMIQLQLITGMRSGELVIMRTGDIDRGGPVWVYTPTKHKNQYRGQERLVFIGKRAQDIITPFLKLDPEAFIFSPADATEERLATRTANRKTPRSCGNVAGSNKKAKPNRTPGDRYRDTSYAKAVARACDRAFPAPEGATGEALKAWQKQNRFHPHRLRHTASTRFRREHNLDTARALLGQKSMKAAEVYAELDMTKARDVMAISG